MTKELDTYRYATIEKFCPKECVSTDFRFKSEAMNRLEQDVESFLALGWQIHGDSKICFAPNGDMRCYQTMTHPTGGKLPSNEA